MNQEHESKNIDKIDLATLVARIDERTANTDKIISEIKIDFNAFKQEIKERYVTTAEFSPVKTIAYSLVGVIVISVIGAILKLVITT